MDLKAWVEGDDFKAWLEEIAGIAVCLDLAEDEGIAAILEIQEHLTRAGFTEEVVDCRSFMDETFANRVGGVEGVEEIAYTLAWARRCGNFEFVVRTEAVITDEKGFPDLSYYGEKKWEVTRVRSLAECHPEERQAAIVRFSDFMAVLKPEIDKWKLRRKDASSNEPR